MSAELRELKNEKTLEVAFVQVGCKFHVNICSSGTSDRLELITVFLTGSSGLIIYDLVHRLRTHWGTVDTLNF